MYCLCSTVVSLVYQFRNKNLDFMNWISKSKAVKPFTTVWMSIYRSVHRFVLCCVNWLMNRTKVWREAINTIVTSVAKNAMPSDAYNYENWRPFWTSNYSDLFSNHRLKNWILSSNSRTSSTLLLTCLHQKLKIWRQTKSRITWALCSYIAGQVLTPAIISHT